MIALTATAGAMTKTMAEMAVAVALVFGLTGIAHCNQGCAAAMTQDDLYRAETASCAATSPTLAASKACRAGVNKKYNVCETDAGLTNCKE